MLNREIRFAYLASLNVGIVFLNIPPGMSVLMDLYDISYTGISILMSALLWSHALIQIPAGLVADWFGIRNTEDCNRKHAGTAFFMSPRPQSHSDWSILLSARSVFQQESASIC